MIVYKIRNKKTGKFSSGGYCPSWDDVGKSYSSLKSVIAHIKLYMRGYSQEEKMPKPDSWEVVELEIKPIEISKIDIKDLMKI